MIEHRTLHRHFKAADPIMAAIVKQVGPATIKPQRDRFKLLVRSIISQQISTAAGRTIRERLEASLGREGIKPEVLARRSVEQLREVGVSRQKASYIIDLAQKCHDGTVRLPRLAKLPDEEVIAELVQVKGIGRWSAQMFLIFALGRPDVFPYDDLGVRSAIRRLYEFKELPTKDECLAIGARWRPYSSLGSWYCWRYMEIKPR